MYLYCNNQCESLKILITVFIVVVSVTLLWYFITTDQNQITKSCEMYSHLLGTESCFYTFKMLIICFSFWGQTKTNDSVLYKFNSGLCSKSYYWQSVKYLVTLYQPPALSDEFSQLSGQHFQKGVIRKKMNAWEP